MGLNHLQSLICTYSADDLRPLVVIREIRAVSICNLFRPLLKNTTYLKLYKKFLFKEKPIWSFSEKYRKKVQPTSLLES